MLKVFNCDLHIHTCLSPCAELDMHPRKIVTQAIQKRLDMIAICDHNASANVPYVAAAAAGKDLIILPGMEITTREEVHLLALFESIENLVKLRLSSTSIFSAKTTKKDSVFKPSSMNKEK